MMLNVCVPHFQCILCLEPQRTTSCAKVLLPVMRIGTAERVLIQPVGKVAHGDVRRKYRIECLHRHM